MRAARASLPDPDVFWPTRTPSRLRVALSAMHPSRTTVATKRGRDYHRVLGRVAMRPGRLNASYWLHHEHC